MDGRTLLAKSDFPSKKERKRAKRESRAAAAF
jgi:hypothetical protein